MLRVCLVWDGCPTRGGAKVSEMFADEKNSGLPESVPVPEQGLRLCSGGADRHGAGPAPTSKYCAYAATCSNTPSKLS